MAINKSVVFYILITVRWASTSNAYQTFSCPGEVLTIKCAIMGGGATVWQGTALQCDSNDHDIIDLRHTQFRISEKPIGTCNDGAIVARAIGVVNNSYISELNVTVSNELNNTTVECAHDYNLTTTIVRSIQINVLSTDFGVSPDLSYIGILNINSSEVTFHWTQPDSICSVSHYVLTATNCGTCPSVATRTDTQAKCTYINTDGRVCTFDVQAIGYFNGTQNISIMAVFKVPDIPRVNVLHYKAANESQGAVLRVLVNEVAPFNITDGLDGSATSYTISYTDLTSGYICGSTTIPALACESGVCSDWFDISSSLCAQSTNITVTAFATNLLGDGPPSQPTCVQKTLLSENEVAGCSVHVYEQLELRFIIFTTLSSAANIFLLVSIVVIAILLVMKRRKNQRDTTVGNERTETTAVYEEINLHPPPSSSIDTRENIAYRHIFS